MTSSHARSTLGLSKKDILYVPTVFLIPLLVVYIQFYAPEFIQQMMIVRFPDPHPLSIWGGGYMHPVDAWAIGNIKGLLIISSLAYLFFASMNEHKSFLKIVLALGVFVPILSTISSIIVAEVVFGGPPPGIAPTGSSGIISAMVGALIIGMYTYIHRLYGRGRALKVIALVFLFIIKGITFARGLTPPLETNIVLGVIGLIILLTLIPRRWANNTLFNVVVSLKYHHRAMLLVPIPFLFLRRTANSLAPVMDDEFREVVTISIHASTLVFGIIVSVLALGYISFKLRNR